MIDLKYSEFKDGSVEFSKSEFSRLLAERRATLRALWLARANRAYWQARTLEGIEYASQAKKWYNVNKKCRAKAEEFLIKEQK